MKNDKEFIAGIYRKAEKRKREEEINMGHGHPFRAWRSLAAAACLCLLVSGAVYAGSRKETPQEGNVSEKNAVMALSLDEQGIPSGDEDMSGSGGMRARMVDEDETPNNLESEGMDTYRGGAQGGEREEKSAVLNGFWAGCESACSMMGEIPSAKNGMEMQEAGGN